MAAARAKEAFMRCDSGRYTIRAVISTKARFQRLPQNSCRLPKKRLVPRNRRNNSRRVAASTVAGDAVLPTSSWPAECPGRRPPGPNAIPRRAGGSWATTLPARCNGNQIRRQFLFYRQLRLLPLRIHNLVRAAGRNGHKESVAVGDRYPGIRFGGRTGGPVDAVF